VPNGPWEVTIVLVDHKGTLVDEDMPVTFRVSPAPPAAP
jgi:hypothetical protein